MSAEPRMPEGYRAPSRRARGELREKGSRFLALVVPVADREEARARRLEIEREHPNASHHCWAVRLGEPADERASDAGEPSGTAGEPMLRVLRGERLSDVLAVVVRWFGGVKLGKGGLARAYAGAVREALLELETEFRFPTVELTVEAPYDRVGAIKNLIRPPEIELVEEVYGEGARLVLRVARHRRAEIETLFADWRLLIQSSQLRL